jgi:hypothetical protein
MARNALTLSPFRRGLGVRPYVRLGCRINMARIVVEGVGGGHPFSNNESSVFYCVHVYRITSSLLRTIGTPS